MVGGSEEGGQGPAGLISPGKRRQSSSASVLPCLSVVLNNTAGLTAGPAIAIPRASSPLTVSPQSATSTGGQAQPTPEDENEPVSVTITVKASGS